MLIWLHDPEAQVRRSRGCHHLSRFQFDVLRTEIIEQSRSGPEKHRHEMKPDFIDEPDAHGLLGNRRPTHHEDVVVARRGLGTARRALDARCHS